MIAIKIDSLTNKLFNCILLRKGEGEMKEIPPITGWPSQTSFVRQPQTPRKKRRSKKDHSHR
jgi:hypothetical protein